MRWAFWRTDAYDRPLEPDPLSRTAPATAPDGSPPAADDPDPDRPVTPAFSGATPSPGSGGHLGDKHLPGPPAADLAALLDVLVDDAPAHELAAVRADLLDLVGAALMREAAAAQRVLDRVTARGETATTLTSAAALAALRDRLVLAAGHDPGEELRGGLATAAAVTQGDTVAGRAGPLLRGVAPDCPRGLVRRVVRRSLGVPDDPPGGVQGAAAADETMALVAAALLAQTVLDEVGDLRALEQELHGLLPDG